VEQDHRFLYFIDHLNHIKTNSKSCPMLNKLTFYTINNSSWVTSWFKQFCSSSQLQKAGFYKRSGASVLSLLRLLAVLPMTGFSLYEFKDKALPVPGRDAFYRMLQHPGYNWRMLLYSISQQLICYLATLTDRSNPRVLIVDDSSYKRDRSKRVEYLGKQRDHSQGRLYRGFRMLTVAWSDGHSCIPCEVELLTNESADKRYGPDPNLDKRTAMGQRIKAATQKATELTKTMVKRARRYLDQVDYVLFDSWFAFPGVICEIAEHTPVVCRLKDIAAIKFRHNNRIYSVKTLPGLFQTMPKSRKHPHIIGTAIVELLNTNLRVRVVVVAHKKYPERSIVFLSTDTTLTAPQVCQIYARRWDIEVCFKALKQHLGLYELQLRNYGAIVACCSISFLRCMMISYYHRSQIDHRTLPGVFYDCISQLQAATVEACIQLLKEKIVQACKEQPDQPAGLLIPNITAVIDQFIALIGADFRPRNQLQLKCES